MTASVLAEKKPREFAGATALRAFDFQIHISVARILEAHGESGPYFALFDHFDDLVVVKGADDTPAISFYQIKSKETGAWTAARLASRPKIGDLPKSIIGKAYYNIVQFGSLVSRASVLSNQPLHGQLAAGGKVPPDAGEVILSTLCKHEHTLLVKALTADFAESLNPAHKELLRFERVPFDLQSYRDTVLGRVTLFLEKLGPDTGAVAKPFYDALISEATRCTGNKTKPADLMELKARKGISREDVNSLIGQAQQRLKTPMEWWPTVTTELHEGGFKALKQQRIFVRCMSYWRAREMGAATANQLSFEIRTAIDNHPQLISDALLPSADAIGLVVKLKAPEGEPYDLLSALIVEIMEVMK